MSADDPRLILVDFTAKLPDGSVIDTTKKEDYPAGAPTVPLKPRLVSLGYPSFVVARGLEKTLKDAELNVPQTIQVEPKDAYGVWDRKMVRMVTIRKLDDHEKYGVGDEITIGGRTGVIKFMSSGRVQVDFNHRYAGKIIQYDFTITDLLDTDNAKIDAILEEAGMGDGSDYTLQENSLRIIVPDNMIRNEGLQNKIYQLQMNIFRFVPNIKDIQFIIWFTPTVKSHQSVQPAS